MPLAKAQSVNPGPTLSVTPIDTADAWFSAGDIMNVVLVLGIIAILISFYRAHKDKTNQFNLLDLIMEKDEDGSKRLSLLKSMAAGGWAVYTWAVVRWIVTGSVTTGDMQSYAAACIAPVVAAVVANAAARKKDKE